MNPERILKDIKNQFKDILTKYPEEKKTALVLFVTILSYTMLKPLFPRTRTTE